MSRIFLAKRGMLVAFLTWFALSSVAAADSIKHWTTGTGGTHSTSSHSTYNPGHIWASIKADHSGDISSGGRFHDSCTSTRCYGAFAGSDYALDIAGGGGTSAKLYIDFDSVGSGGDPAPDNNRNMAVFARVADQGNFRNDPTGRPACSWQKLDILATYYDSAGNQYGSKVIGEYWIAHVTNFAYSVGTVINTNAVKSNPNGTGNWYYVDGISIGTIYNGADVAPPGDHQCSTGAHTHVEFLSNHNWGSEYEWHNDAGPDGYNGLSGITDHIHGSSVGAPYTYTGAEGVTQGSSSLSHIGGDKTLFWMRDNPYWMSH